MKKIIVLFLTITVTAFSNLVAQHSENGVVGFSCSFFGKPSLSVMKMSKLVSKSQYDKVKGKLVKGSMGEKYLAIILCETLVEENKIMLTETEKNIVKASYFSKARVPICAGCTMFQTVSMSELLNRTSVDYFGGRARKWAKSVINGSF